MKKIIKRLEEEGRIKRRREKREERKVSIKIKDEGRKLREKEERVKEKIMWEKGKKV